ncbi:hypothetical protein OIO90_005205 [Microbotryomycetes sp. JL221]|nr:hypothetical protein OIO90_005205 [Microbotryomycetes sp. JL221]
MRVCARLTLAATGLASLVAAIPTINVKTDRLIRSSVDDASDRSNSYRLSQQQQQNHQLEWSQQTRLGIDAESMTNTNNKVPVILGVMSKCPDAQVCEIVFDRVLDQVGQQVDLNLVYIGTLDNKSQPYGVECMHGTSECAGNIQQLCAAKHFQGQSGEINPFADWWNASLFIQCVNYGPTSKIGDESIAQRCSAVVGHKWQEIESCVRGSEGIELLKRSVTMANELAITKSCTIVIGGKPVCVHDGTWKHCDEGHETGHFVRQS